MRSDLTLRRPREDEEEEFLRGHRVTSPRFRDGMPFRRYLEVLAEQEHGVNLPPNHVPSTFLFAFVGNRIVGRAEIGHRVRPITAAEVVARSDFTLPSVALFSVQANTMISSEALATKELLPIGDPLRSVHAYPNAAGHITGVTKEPRVLVVVRRPGFARRRISEA